MLSKPRHISLVGSLCTQVTDDADPVPRDVGRTLKRFRSNLASIHIKAQRILLEFTFDPSLSEGANKNTCRSRLEDLSQLCSVYQTADATYDCQEIAYLRAYEFCEEVWVRGGRFRERMGIKTFIKSRTSGAACTSWQECTDT